MVLWQGAMSTTGHREEMHRHSGWWIPGALLFVLVLLSGLLLGWYLRPGPRSQTAPTAQSGPVRLSLHGIAFAIPANYIENAQARTGGERDAVTLVMLFPSWRGFSQDQARLFVGNAPDSPLVRLSLHGDPNSLDAQERLNRLYQPNVSKSEQAPFGLTRYVFVADSAYGANELYAGGSDKGLILFLCERASLEFSSPNCAAIDRPLAPGLSYSYRFKRAYLARWREVFAGVDQLIVKFRQR
jgi:hypothetical protein